MSPKIAQAVLLSALCVCMGCSNEYARDEDGEPADVSTSDAYSDVEWEDSGVVWDVADDTEPVDASPVDARAEEDTASDTSEPGDVTGDSASQDDALSGVDVEPTDVTTDTFDDVALDSGTDADLEDTASDVGADASSEDGGDTEVDLCAGVVCDVPEPSCDGDTAVRFIAARCVEGVCGEPRRVEQRCLAGTCVEGLCETPLPVFVDSGQRLTSFGTTQGCNPTDDAHHANMQFWDFNDDGLDDVIFVHGDNGFGNYCPNQVYSSDGLGYFSLEMNVQNGGGVTDVGVGVFSENGRESVYIAVRAVTSLIDASRDVYVDCSSGDCEARDAFLESCWSHVAMGDFDGNGIDEMLVFESYYRHCFEFCEPFPPDEYVSHIPEFHGVEAHYFYGYDGLVSDFNNDGLQDVLTLGTVRVFLQSPDPDPRLMFGLESSMDALGEAFVGALVDTNGDGCVGAALVMEESVHVFENDCDGNMYLIGVLEGDTALNQYRSGVDVADLDGDHDEDIVVSTGLRGDYSGEILFYLNDGVGNFSVHVPPGVDERAGPSRRVGLRDLDRDGDVDMVVAGLIEPSTVWFNRTYDPLCEDVVCDPPANTCDGDTVVRYEGQGVCIQGTCRFDEVTARETCSAGTVCDAGVCVEP